MKSVRSGQLGGNTDTFIPTFSADALIFCSRYIFSE